MKKLFIIMLTIALLFNTGVSTCFALNTERNVGFYNGLSPNESWQSIGATTSADGEKWTKSVEPILKKRPNLFDSSSINGPYSIQIGELIYVYYAGYNGAKWNGIGLAIFTKDLHLLSRPRQPVLKLGDIGDWDDSKIYRPIVILNPNLNEPNKKFVMYYNGANSSGVNCTGIAYSPDGINWTKNTESPVLTPGSTGEWDSMWAFADDVYLVGDTYYMAYNGYDGTRIQTGIATSTTLEGPWVKLSVNPILATRTTAVQNLTGDVSVGSTTIMVSDSSKFVIDEPCYLTSSAGTENVRVKAKPDSTTIELYEPAIFAHTVTGNGALKSILSKSAGPNQIEYDGVTWKIYGSCWGVVPGYETSTLAEGTDLNSMDWIFDKMPTINYDTVATQDWDSKSQENLKFIYID